MDLGRMLWVEMAHDYIQCWDILCDHPELRFA